MIPAAKQSSQIIPRLPNETKQGMITLPALLLRIVAHRRPLLPIKNRGHMGIQIQGQGLEDSKALAKLHQQTKIQKSNLLRHGHSQPRQETAHRRLYRKTKPSHDLDENAIGGQNPHLPRPGIPQKHAVKQTHQHGPDAIFTLPTTRNLNLLLYLLLQVMALEKLSDQPGTAKASQVFPSEFFLNSFNFM